MNTKTMLWYFPLVALAVEVSRHFLDARIALAVMKLINSSSFLQVGTSDIPDVLFLFVLLGSCFFWGEYLILRHRGIFNERTRFSQLAGSSLVVAYLLKGFFKFVFGRMNTRVWLVNQGAENRTFHWFSAQPDYSGFPSGHMAVFTAFFTAVWLFYPRYRSFSLGLTLILAAALIITDYHYLSDVIAGTYLGLMTTCLTRAYLEKKIF